MTRRKHPPAPVDLDDYGFDLVGEAFDVQPQELVCLIGLDALACQLYFMCLRPFASHRIGDVREASYYRFIHRLTPRQPRSGPRVRVPTKDDLRGALQRLQAFGLVKLFPTSSMREGALQIRVVRRFGVVSTDSNGPGVRPGSRSPRSRAVA